VEFDATPPPRLDFAAASISNSPRPLEKSSINSPRPLGEGQGVRGARLCSMGLIDLDGDFDSNAAAFPAAADRAQAFTLWLRSADFHECRHEAVKWTAQMLADNPHTTLQVILEPTGAPERLTAATLQMLLASCYEHTTYLDRYYSMYPGPLLGSKRIAVLLPWEQRAVLGHAWRVEMSQSATLLWQGGPSRSEAETLDAFEQVVPPLRG